MRKPGGAKGKIAYNKRLVRRLMRRAGKHLKIGSVKLYPREYYQ